MSYRNRFLASIIVTLVFVSLFSSAIGQTETPAPLKKFGDALVGRWSSEIIWAVDYPGLGKKGEKVTGYDTMSWIADGQGIEGKWLSGQTVGTYIIWWDASSKQIKVMSLDSSGRSSQGTIRIKGKKFVGKASGSFTDGRKVEYEWETSFEDKGNTRIETGATILDGVRNEFRDVFKRLTE